MQKVSNRTTAQAVQALQKNLTHFHKTIYSLAPYVKEFPIIVECRVTHTIELGSHTQFIGEILDIKVDKSILDEKGHASIKKANPIVCGIDSIQYCEIGEYLGDAFKIGTTIS